MQDGHYNDSANEGTRPLSGEVRTSKAEKCGGGALRYLQTSQATMQVLDTTIDERWHAHADFTKPHRFMADSTYIVASCDRTAFVVEGTDCLSLKLPPRSIKEKIDSS
jgi:hypothetical protein